jgi:transcriptional regulator with XRE-family HTH domain
MDYVFNKILPVLYGVLLPLVVILLRKDAAMSNTLDNFEIGRRIKRFRKHKGLSQERLAELIGVSFQQVQKYESGVNRLNTDKLQAIAHTLSVPVASFFEDQPIEALPFSDQERTLIESFRTITDRSIKECILEFCSFAGKR